MKITLFYSVKNYVDNALRGKIANLFHVIS